MNPLPAPRLASCPLPPRRRAESLARERLGGVIKLSGMAGPWWVIHPTPSFYLRLQCSGSTRIRHSGCPPTAGTSPSTAAPLLPLPGRWCRQPCSVLGREAVSSSWGFLPYWDPAVIQPDAGVTHPPTCQGCGHGAGLALRCRRPATAPTLLPKHCRRQAPQSCSGGGRRRGRAPVLRRPLLRFPQSRRGAAQRSPGMERK